MKKIATIMLATALACGCLALAGCGGGAKLSESDQACLDTLKAGLQQRWDINSEEVKTVDDEWAKYEKGIEAELKALTDCQSGGVEDEALGELLEKYTKAVESQKKGVGYVFEDAKEFTKYYIDEGQTVRSECISTLVSDYGFKVDEEYKDNIDGAINPSDRVYVNPGEKITVTDVDGEREVEIAFKECLVDPTYDPEYSVEKCSLLLCEVKNISDEGDRYEGDSGTYIELENYFCVMAGDNTEIAFSSYGDNYKTYASCPGTIAELKQGHKKKFSVRILYTKKGKHVAAMALNGDTIYTCYLKVK